MHLDRLIYYSLAFIATYDKLLWLLLLRSLLTSSHKILSINLILLINKINIRIRINSLYSKY